MSASEAVRSAAVAVYECLERSCTDMPLGAFEEVVSDTARDITEIGEVYGNA